MRFSNFSKNYENSTSKFHKMFQKMLGLYVIYDKHFVIYPKLADDRKTLQMIGKSANMIGS